MTLLDLTHEELMKLEAQSLHYSDYIGRALVALRQAEDFMMVAKPLDDEDFQIKNRFGFNLVYIDAVRKSLYAINDHYYQIRVRIYELTRDKDKDR